ncbi:hypothetical protein PS862_00282 [Pseudomonas fluorescens]|uniref:Yip1 domain-containing protein n=1 Tax=Pseudomonas fluorescens TaxID=294 RepID=A0A5E7GI06_PSEFL|nr:hypothetical protein [Pseudomonas fluorescens]VVO50407.1 hypothetical protein PS862_00282 [Pseudomonas fluorescens]
MQPESLSTIAGPTGVGSLCMLGLFLLFDGRAPSLLPTFEEYARTATWGIVAALPVLVMAYVIGLFLSVIATAAIQYFFGPDFSQEAIDIASLSKLSVDKTAAIQVYLQLLADRTTLAGSGVALLFLAGGAISEIDNLQNLKVTIWAIAVGVGLLSVAMIWLAVQKGVQAHTIALTMSAAL